MIRCRVHDKQLSSSLYVLLYLPLAQVHIKYVIASSVCLPDWLVMYLLQAMLAVYLRVPVTRAGRLRVLKCRWFVFRILASASLVFLFLMLVRNPCSVPKNAL